MLETYDRPLNQKALDFAMENNIKAHEGIYVGLQGPNLETPAEYEYLHRIGGDVVGMSTVPEVIVARHMSLPLFVVSVISNKCYPTDNIPSASVEEIIEIAIEAGAKMQRVVSFVLHQSS
jgi:purine-nucleoside phosphorylase